MKKINLRGISEILSEKELKNVMGGSGRCTIDDCHANKDCSSTENGITMSGKCWMSSDTCYCNRMV